MLNSPGVKKFGSEEEAAKIIGELYKQVLALPSIQVIDIDKNPLKEKEESKERSRELFSIGQGEGEEQETGVIESTSNLSSTICGSVISSASSSVISTPTIPGELVSTEIIPEISFSGESIEVQEF